MFFSLQHTTKKKLQSSKLIFAVKIESYKILRSLLYLFIFFYFITYFLSSSGCHLFDQRNIQPSNKQQHKNESLSRVKCYFNEMWMRTWL